MWAPNDHWTIAETTRWARICQDWCRPKFVQFCCLWDCSCPWSKQISPWSCFSGGNWNHLEQFDIAIPKRIEMNTFHFFGGYYKPKSNCWKVCKIPARVKLVWFSFLLAFHVKETQFYRQRLQEQNLQRNIGAHESGFQQLNTHIWVWYGVMVWWSSTIPHPFTHQWPDKQIILAAHIARHVSTGTTFRLI